MMHSFFPTLPDSSQTACKARAWGNYVANLVNEGIWPQSMGFQGISLQTLFDKVRGLPESNGDFAVCRVIQYGHCHCNSCTGSYSMTSKLDYKCLQLNTLLGASREFAEGYPSSHLCLDCLKAGASRSGDPETRCRTPHVHGSNSWIAEGINW